MANSNDAASSDVAEAEAEAGAGAETGAEALVLAFLPSLLEGREVELVLSRRRLSILLLDRLD